MATDFSDILTALTDYSWADIAKAAKQAMVTVALGGQTLTMKDGRQIEHVDLDKLKKLYEFALEQSTSDNGVALVKFGERV